MERINIIDALSSINQFLHLLKAKGTIECDELEEMILVADGCESQNWSINIFGHIVRIINNEQSIGSYPKLKKLTFVKTAGIQYILLDE